MPDIRVPLPEDFQDRVKARTMALREAIVAFGEEEACRSIALESVTYQVSFQHAQSLLAVLNERLGKVNEIVAQMQAKLRERSY